MTTRLAPAIALALAASCAGRTNVPEKPERAGAPARPPSPAAEVTPDAAAQPPDATAEATADAGEAFVLPSMSPPNESNRAWMRHLIAPIMSLDMSECRHGDPAFYDCWCRLVCGVRLEASDSTITISWPYNEAGGPGFKAAPDGHIEACWHTGAGLPETHLTCPPR